MVSPQRQRFVHLMELKSESTLQHLNNYVAGEVNVAFAKMALSLTFSYPQGTTAA